MGITFNPQSSDVNDNAYLSGTVTVGTSAVEAKVGGSALAEREMVRIHNISNSTVYFGPSGVTTSSGEPLYKNQWVSLPAGPNNPVYLIRASGSSDVIVQEMS